MKSLTFLLLALTTIASLFTNCKKNNSNSATSCTKITDTTHKNLFFTDGNATSIYYHQVVGTYTFDKIKVSYSGANNCPQDSLITSLIIVNSTPKIMTLSYDFYYASPVGTLCGMGSVYKDSVSIPANSFINRGFINKSLIPSNGSCTEYFDTFTIKYQ